MSTMRVFWKIRTKYNELLLKNNPKTQTYVRKKKILHIQFFKLNPKLEDTKSTILIQFLMADEQLCPIMHPFQKIKAGYFIIFFISGINVQTYIKTKKFLHIQFF